MAPSAPRPPYPAGTKATSLPPHHATNPPYPGPAEKATHSTAALDLRSESSLYTERTARNILASVGYGHSLRYTHSHSVHTPSPVHTMCQTGRPCTPRDPSDPPPFEQQTEEHPQLPTRHCTHADTNKLCTTCRVHGPPGQPHCQSPLFVLPTPHPQGDYSQATPPCFRTTIPGSSRWRGLTPRASHPHASGRPLPLPRPRVVGGH